LALEIPAISTNEALVEAGNTYETVLAETGDQERAETGARITFGTNLPILLVSNRLGMFAGRNKALREGVAGLKQTAVTAAKGAAGEGIQEFTQSTVGQVAEEIAIEDATLAQALSAVDYGQAVYEGVIGSVVGGGISVLLERADAKIEQIPELSPAQTEAYNETVAAEKAKGASTLEANITATKQLAETPEGEAYIDKVMEAQDAVIQAEAAMGTDIKAEEVKTLAPAPATTQAAFDEVTAPESQLTEDEAVERILEAVEQEQAQAAVATQEAALIQEALPTAQNIEQVDPQTIPDIGTPGARAFKATMPNGSAITVVTGADIQITPEKIEQIRKTYVEPGNIAGVSEEVLRSDNFIIAGQNQIIGEDNIIALSKEAARPQEVLNEEVYELAEKSILTPEEIQTLETEFGPSIENRSKAYAAWDGTTQTANGLLEKVRDFFKGILDRFRAPKLTPEEVFRRVREGEVFERGARPEGEETFAIQPGQKIIAEPVPIDERLNELTDIDAQLRAPTPLDVKGLRASRDDAIEAANETINDNPEGPRLLYRATSKKDIARGPEGVLEVNAGYVTRDPQTDADMSGIWFSTSLRGAIQHGKKEHGPDAVIMAMPVINMPDEVIAVNNTGKNNLDYMWFAMPGSVNLDAVEIKDLTEVENDGKFLIEREVPDAESQRERDRRLATGPEQRADIGEPGLPEP
ncbi:MAG: hypothetical protein ACYTEQ_29290, partial [Planctomycetota bacterium]